MLFSVTGAQVSTLKLFILILGIPFTLVGWNLFFHIFFSLLAILDGFWNLSSQPGIKSSAVKVWSPSRWTSREFSVYLHLTPHLPLLIYSSWAKTSSVASWETPALERNVIPCIVWKYILTLPLHLIWLDLFYFWGFPCGSAGKESACNDPWVGNIPWGRERLPTPVSWPGEFHGLYSPWVH